MTARPAPEARAPFIDLRPAESWARIAVRGDLFLGRFDANYLHLKRPSRM